MSDYQARKLAAQDRWNSLLRESHPANRTALQQSQIDNAREDFYWWDFKVTQEKYWERQSAKV